MCVFVCVCGGGGGGGQGAVCGGGGEEVLETKLFFRRGGWGQGQQLKEVRPKK